MVKHNQESKFQVDQCHQGTPLLNSHSIFYDGYSVTTEDPASSNVEQMQRIVTTKELIAHLLLTKSLYRIRHLTEQQRGFLNKNNNDDNILSVSGLSIPKMG